MLHGNSLSMSRLVLTQSIMSYASDSDVFTEKDGAFLEKDGAFLEVVSLTITGSVEDRHVFSATLIDKKQLKHFSPALKAILLKFDARAGSLANQSADAVGSDEGWALGLEGGEL
eukprot:gene32672-40314_t